MSQRTWLAMASCAVRMGSVTKGWAARGRVDMVYHHPLSEGIGEDMRGCGGKGEGLTRITRTGTD